MSLCDDSTENDHENYEAPTANIVTLINTLMDYLTVHGSTGRAAAHRPEVREGGEMEGVGKIQGESENRVEVMRA